jgi:hypothetical protein
MFQFIPDGLAVNRQCFDADHGDETILTNMPLEETARCWVLRRKVSKLLSEKTRQYRLEHQRVRAGSIDCEYILKMACIVLAERPSRVRCSNLLVHLHRHDIAAIDCCCGCA